MKRHSAILAPLAGALALSACATTGAEEPSPPSRAEGECKAEAGQAFVGQKATAETGAALIAATGARTLRWVPPRTAVTMDFRPDRLTVSYDDDMVIERVSCT
ncbi:peptidase inhibitor I78 [Erythrobacter sp. SG61-1L]|uniref:I78 family peptidase inhibitor n=1 Tax=Erythrobacter sp. SG61-1L TaxID=1603897 RepID=UPI0006C8E8EE|nr:I78 family peptidase inhibitor [Erythrobacter sp. SG61-1L]KPL68599.1 peptidase inhibitor I78 [Erythrobacter sp. SG61-1L]